MLKKCTLEPIQLKINYEFEDQIAMVGLHQEYKEKPDKGITQ